MHQETFLDGVLDVLTFTVFILALPFIAVAEFIRSASDAAYVAKLEAKPALAAGSVLDPLNHPSFSPERKQSLQRAYEAHENVVLSSSSRRDRRVKSSAEW